MTDQEHEKLMRDTRKHVADLMEKLEMKESATAVFNVISNDQMALGLIKLLLSFSSMNYIACQQQHKRDNEDTQIYIESALNVAYQWKAMQLSKTKKENKNAS